MNRKLGAAGLMLAAVGGFAASSATSAAADGLPNVVKDLSYEDQNKIYRDLTAKSYDFLGLTGKNLKGTSNQEIMGQLNSLREKDKEKFDRYISENYAANSLVSSWSEIPAVVKDGVTPFNELRDKLNKNEGSVGSSSLYDKKYLVQNPYSAIDAAYNTNSILVSDVDKSALMKKVKDNAKFFGLDSSGVNSSSTISGVGSLVDSSAAGAYSSLVADSLKGKDATVSKGLKTKYYAKVAATWVAAFAVVTSAYEGIKWGYEKVVGKKSEVNKVGTEAVQVIEEKENILLPYDEGSTNTPARGVKNPMGTTKGAVAPKVENLSAKAVAKGTNLDKNQKKVVDAASPKSNAKISK